MIDRARALLETPGLVLWLTGAGISAESGIPTFRGKEGYWRVGSRNHRPQEMATRQAFGEMPDEVWSWYLYRRSVCQNAVPNVAHQALAALEQRVPDRFLLVTQNVDGLHLRAGNTSRRTYQIHGNIDYMRCTRECLNEPVPIPENIDAQWPKERRVEARERSLLICPACGAMARPHVLWFDESYNEQHFRFESSMTAAGAASAVVVVGTTGATHLPMQIGTLAARRGVPLLVINPEPNPFSAIAEQTGKGVFLQGTAGGWVAAVAECVV